MNAVFCKPVPISEFCTILLQGVKEDALLHIPTIRRFNSKKTNDFTEQSFSEIRNEFFLKMNDNFREYTLEIIFFND